MSPTLIVVIAAVLVIGFGVSIYNSMVKARNHFKNAFSQIDVQLKRRYDLIPNLVETAKGYMAHEKETLEAVVKARNTALAAVEAVAANPGNGTAMQSLGSAEGLLGQALGKFNIAMEAYPDLKADGSIQNVMEELTSTENKIAFSRQAFNDSVMNYNNKREVFPNNIFAGLFGFEAANQLEIEFGVGERDAPKVSF